MNHHSPVIQYCPHCGTKTEIQSIYNESRPHCPNCGWTHYEDPKVAAAVVVLSEGRLLLTRRIFQPHQGAWTLPAGFVNAYEKPEDAARRECREETGLQVRIVRLLDLISGREHPRGADMVIVYLAEVTGGQLSAGDDADQVGYFSLDDLPELGFAATNIVVTRLKNGGYPLEA